MVGLVLLRLHMEGNNRPEVLCLSLECTMSSETFFEKLSFIPCADVNKSPS